VPTFPNARYLFGKTEYAHWESERGKQGEGKVNDGSFDDSVLPVVEAGKAVMIESDHQPDPLLTIKDYPGHTPGSIAINLKDDGRQACFSGDIMHHPIQIYHPDWSSQFCWDQAMSARSRRQLAGGLRREQRTALPGPLSRRQRGGTSRPRATRSASNGIGHDRRGRTRGGPAVKFRRGF